MPAIRGRVGYDQPYYTWSPIVERQPVRWPAKATLAFSVIVTLEHFEASPPPEAVTSRDLQGGLGNRPFPDYARISHREYGHRVGIFRVLDRLERHGIRPAVALDAMSAERYPFLVEHIKGRGAEIIAHGISVNRMISSRMNENEEREYIDGALRRIEIASGVRPYGWLGPEYGESERTPRLLAEAGIRYVCDWTNDEQPYPMLVPSGDLTSLPIAIEFDDAYALSLRGSTLDSYERMVTEGAERLHADGELSGRMLLLNLHPWLIGQPFRVKSLDRICAYITQLAHAWVATPSEIASQFAGERVE